MEVDLQDNDNQGQDEPPNPTHSHFQCLPVTNVIVDPRGVNVVRDVAFIAAIKLDRPTGGGAG